MYSLQYLMSFYLFFADRHGRGSGTRWAIMGMAVKVAQSIGLRKYFPCSLPPIEMLSNPQTVTVVDGRWNPRRLNAEGIFSGSFTPMTRGRYVLEITLVVIQLIIISALRLVGPRHSRYHILTARCLTHRNQGTSRVVRFTVKMMQQTDH